MSWSKCKQRLPMLWPYSRGCHLMECSQASWWFSCVIRVEKHGRRGQGHPWWEPKAHGAKSASWLTLGPAHVRSPHQSCQNEVQLSRQECGIWGATAPSPQVASVATLCCGRNLKGYRGSGVGGESEACEGRDRSGHRLSQDPSATGHPHFSGRGAAPLWENIC